MLPVKSIHHLLRYTAEIETTMISACFYCTRNNSFSLFSYATDMLLDENIGPGEVNTLPSSPPMPAAEGIPPTWPQSRVMPPSPTLAKTI